jgi:hypothetical protein
MSYLIRLVFYVRVNIFLYTYKYIYDAGCTSRLVSFHVPLLENHGEKYFL